MSNNRRTFLLTLIFLMNIFINHVTSSIPIRHQPTRNGGESIIRMRRNADSGYQTHGHIHNPIIREKKENSGNLNFESRDANKNQQPQQWRNNNDRDRARRQTSSRNDAEHRHSRDTTHDRNRRAAEMNNQIVKQSAESRTQNQNRDVNPPRANANASPTVLVTNYQSSRSERPTQLPASTPISSSGTVTQQGHNPNSLFNSSTTSGSPSSPSSSVVVVSGLSKYSVLHLVPPTGTHVHEIQNTLDDPQQRYALNSKKNSDSVSEKTGLAIVLIEFEVLDDDDTFETILETVEK